MEIIEFNEMDNFLPSIEKVRMLNLIESTIIIEQKEKNSLIFSGNFYQRIEVLKFIRIDF